MTKKKPQKTRSWRAHYWYTGGPGGIGCLLGGVLRSVSCHYGEEADAHFRLKDVLAANREAGRPCEGVVEPSDRPPEIFRHCGSPDRPAGAMGGKCFGCGKVLTLRDAKNHVPVPLPGPAAAEPARGGGE